jgi:predicted transcriptional regulator
MPALVKNSNKRLDQNLTSAVSQLTHEKVDRTVRRLQKAMPDKRVNRSFIVRTAIEEFMKRDNLSAFIKNNT